MLDCVASLFETIQNEFQRAEEDARTAAASSAGGAAPRWTGVDADVRARLLRTITEHAHRADAIFHAAEVDVDSRPGAQLNAEQVEAAIRDEQARIEQLTRTLQAAQQPASAATS